MRKTAKNNNGHNRPLTGAQIESLHKKLSKNKVCVQKDQINESPKTASKVLYELLRVKLIKLDTSTTDKNINHEKTKYHT